MIAWLRQSLLRLASLFRRAQLDNDLDAEMSSHLELAIKENLKHSMTSAEARRQALIHFGGTQQAKEQHRDSRGLPWLEALLQDLRFALRMLRKSSGFTAIAGLALALGIGFSTIIFSIFYNGVLYPFPYRAAQRFEIIGVVNDLKSFELHPVLPQAYVPYTFSGFDDHSLLVRTVTNPSLLANNLRQVLADVDPNTVLVNPGTLDEFLQKYVYMKPKFRLISFGTCAGIGLGLALIGLFGVMAYSVTLQTHELGVRMALGAQPANILTLVLRKGLLLVGSGIFIGFLTSFFTVRILQSQLWRVSSFDPWTLLLAPLALLAAGLLACYMPARRATRVDPMISLRYE